MSADPERDVVSLDVGGTTFRVSYSAISNFKNGKLCRMIDQKKLHINQNEQIHAFIDRSVKYFKYILELHRMGTLHLTQGVCWHRLKEELEFWDLDAHACLASCCARRVLEQEEREYLASYLEKQLDDSCSSNLLDGQGNSRDNKNKLASCCHKTWIFMEDPASSISAKIWGILFLMVVLMSVFVQVALSHPMFRRDLPWPKWDISNETNPKMIMFATSEIHPVILRMENICFTVFAADLLLRFAVCPAKLSFMKSIYNLVDIMCIIPMMLMLIVQSSDVEDKKKVFMAAYVLSAFGVFRILRLFKFLRQFLCVRVLLLALKASVREVALLIMLLLVGMLLFSNLIYFAELHVDDQFETIPIGFWWAIVTMSTVGYGDTHPKSSWGYVIGAICAVCGMLLIGIPIPAIANNFNLLYAMARRKRMVRKRNTKKRDGNISPGVVCSHITGGNANGTDIVATPIGGGTGALPR